MEGESVSRILLAFQMMLFPVRQAFSAPELQHQRDDLTGTMYKSMTSSYPFELLIQADVDRG